MGLGGDLVITARLNAERNWTLQTLSRRLTERCPMIEGNSVTTLWRVETGLKILDPNNPQNMQLIRCIAQVLTIEVDVLRDAFQQDVNVKNFFAHGFTLVRLSEYAIGVAASSNRTLLEGRPHDARDELNRWIAIIGERLLSEEKDSIDLVKAKLAHAQIATMAISVQHALSLPKTVMPNTIFYYDLAISHSRHAQESAKSTTDLVEQGKQREIDVNSLFGDSYYITKKWEEGARLAEQAVKSGAPSFEVRQRSYRVWLLCTALGRLGKLDEPEAGCRTIIGAEKEYIKPRDLIRSRIALWETLGRTNIARAEDEIDDGKVIHYLNEGEGCFVKGDEARAFCQNERGDALPSFQFHLIRGRLMKAEVAQKKGVGYDENEVVDYIRQAYKLTIVDDVVRYPRFRRQTNEKVKGLKLEKTFRDELGVPIT